MFVGVSGSFKTITNAYIRASGAWKAVKEGFVYSSGPRPPSSAHFPASTPSPSAAPPSGGSLVTSAPVTTTVEGPANVTHAWEFVSGDGTMTILSAASATTAFRGRSDDATTSRTAIFRDKVTDNDSGDFVYGDEVTVTFTP
mgnify:CR=1 FL=1